MTTMSCAAEQLPVECDESPRCQLSLQDRVEIQCGIAIRVSGGREKYCADAWGASGRSGPGVVRRRCVSTIRSCVAGSK